MNWIGMNQLRLQHYDMQSSMRFMLNLWFRKCPESWANLLSYVNKLMRISDIINSHNLEEQICNSQEQTCFQEIWSWSFMTLWISTMLNSMLQLAQMNERAVSQRMNVLTVIKKSIITRTALWIHIAKYVKSSCSTRIHNLHLKKSMSHY